MGTVPLTLVSERLLGGLRREGGEAPVAGAVWYAAAAPGDGLEFRFPAGALKEAAFLTADLLVAGTHLVVFDLLLMEGESGRKFGMIFSALNECSARMRVKLEAVNQNRWRYEREGAWLKPMCHGDVVDLARVDRMILTVSRKSDAVARFCLTPVTATAEEPPLLEKLVLPKGPLIDELGQSTLHDWPGKSRDADEVTARMKAQLAAAPGRRWPDGFSKWGGWAEKRVRATGLFRTHHDGRRWWLVDPDGCLFWSAGMDCVRVDNVCNVEGLADALTWGPDPAGPYAPMYSAGGRGMNYLAANFIRAFGPGEWREAWAKIALAELKRGGMNTVANWSEWEIARAAGFPYVRPLRLGFPRAKMVFRDFPDVFHPDFDRDAAEFGWQLADTRNDPAFIGYFMMNEPTWGFSPLTPAKGMLMNASECETRKKLGGFLREKYRTDGALSAAWGIRTDFASVSGGKWRGEVPAAAEQDLAAFSSVMCEKFFKTLAASCRAVDPDHLNLGIRYFTVPPPWAVEGMRCFDVFSVNGYEERVRRELGKIAEIFNQPVMVGEWHFGALDAGLPASGIGRVKDQRDRGRAFRIYTEDAAAQPWCVGVHWFTLYDEAALGRFDGENWQIGFMDVCNRPYEEIFSAARESHARMYRVGLGEAAPFDDAPEYLPKLFL